MESTIILLVGTIVLGCGSLGLLIAWCAHGSLKGLGWLGAAFLAGSLGAGLLTGLLWHGRVSVLGGDLCILLAFMLLHIGTLDLTRGVTRFSMFSLVLLPLLALIDGSLLAAGPAMEPWRVAGAGLLIGLQTALTGRVLWHFSRTQIRYPAMCTSLLLLLFAAYNSVRALTVAAGFPRSGAVAYKFVLMTEVVYLAVALGAAFGFFWMTTMLLSSTLDHLASTDPLTRLFNRRVFLLWCEKELQRAKADRGRFSILMMDLDHFKQVNDNFGHSAGDEAICAAVEQMQDSVRGVDVLARWGGEEFTCMLPNAGLESAHIVAERVRANIEKIVLTVPRTGSTELGQLRLTTSIGVASFTPDDDVAAMLERADQALYQAKEGGRNQVRDAVPAMTGERGAGAGATASAVAGSGLR